MSSTAQRRRARNALFLAVAAALLAGCGQESTPLPHAPPPAELQALRQQLVPLPGANVVVVSFDALRRDALGIYGNPLHTTPHLDAFARTGIVFDRAYTVAPVTPTSYAATFSALLPTRSFHAWQFVSQRTLAISFRDAGYATAAFINQAQLTPERGFDRGFERYDWTPSGSDELTLAHAVAWLRDHQQRPFFVWVHFLLPHAPYVYREAARQLYDPGYRGPFERTTGATFSAASPADLARLRELYAGNVLAADHLFGELMDELTVSGLPARTVVVVTSDHGEELGEHGGFQHGRLTEEHVRIPLLLHPAAGGTPLRTGLLVGNVDLGPTLLALVGNPTAALLDGRDLLEVEHPREALVGVAMTDAMERSLSLRRNDEKLVLQCRPKRLATLYDLGVDPEERHDVAAGRPEVVRRLARELEVILGDDPCAALDRAVGSVGPEGGLDRKTAHALRALGYL